MQARTAISLRNERRQEARLGQALDKSGRIFRLAVEVAPIFAGKVGAERTNGAADLRKFVVLLIGERLHAISPPIRQERSEEHTSELQSLMRISYAVFCLKNKTKN